MNHVEQIGDSLHFRMGHFDCAVELIERHHYSGRMAGNVQFVFTWHDNGGLFGDFGQAVAAATFSIPGTRWSEPVIELTRLVKVPNKSQPLTKFLSMCFCELKRRNIDLVVSFADVTHDHHGGIYQAASWSYHGLRENRIDGLIVNDVFVPGRSCNSRWGIRSPSKLSQLKPDWLIEPHRDNGKHLYWKGVTRNGKKKANRLGLKENSYPKPDLFVAPPEKKPEQLTLLEASQ